MCIYIYIYIWLEHGWAPCLQACRIKSIGIYIYIYTHTYIHTYIHTYTYMNTHTLYIYISIYIYIYIYVYVERERERYTHIHTHIYIYTHVHKDIYIYIYIYIHMCIYIYIYIWIWAGTSQLVESLSQGMVLVWLIKRRPIAWGGKTALAAVLCTQSASQEIREHRRGGSVLLFVASVSRWTFGLDVRSWFRFSQEVGRTCIYIYIYIYIRSHFWPKHPQHLFSQPTWQRRRRRRRSRPWRRRSSRRRHVRRASRNRLPRSTRSEKLS